MIASVTYKVSGNEPVEAGQRIIYFYPAAGYPIIDIIVNGLSDRLVTINENYGKVSKAGFIKGDVVTCIYKTLPRSVVLSPVSGLLVDGSGNNIEDGAGNIFATA